MESRPEQSTSFDFKSTFHNRGESEGLRARSDDRESNISSASDKAVQAVQSTPKISATRPDAPDIITRPTRPDGGLFSAANANATAIFLSSQPTRTSLLMGDASTIGTADGESRHEAVTNGEGAIGSKNTGTTFHTGDANSAGFVNVKVGSNASFGSSSYCTATAAVSTLSSAADAPADLTPSTSWASAVTSTTKNGVGGSISDDGLTDSDENVMARLAEFTQMARHAAVQNEELSRKMGTEKRRVANTNRKLEQCNSTCTELRESLALAQDTVIKLREHEMRWAESTANEMSLRAEVCALKDEHASAAGDAAAFKKRCDVLLTENTELGERFAALAEKKRQVEAKARRLLRSDRYRGY